MDEDTRMALGSALPVEPTAEGSEEGRTLLVQAALAIRDLVQGAAPAWRTNANNNHNGVNFPEAIRSAKATYSDIVSYLYPEAPSAPEQAA